MKNESRLVQRLSELDGYIVIGVKDSTIRTHIHLDNKKVHKTLRFYLLSIVRYLDDLLTFRKLVLKLTKEQEDE